MVLLKYETNMYLHSTTSFSRYPKECMFDVLNESEFFNYTVLLKKVIKAFSDFYNNAIFKWLSGFNLHNIKIFSQNL